MINERAERSWQPSKDVYVELADDLLHVYIDGPDGQRCQTISPDDIDRLVAELDAGADPVADGWEDGTGNTVCYGNARSSGYVLVREDADFRVFHTYEEAESEAEDLWDRLSDKAKDNVKIFHISKCDNLVGGEPQDDWDFDETCVRDFVREWEETPRTMYVYFTHGGRVYKAEVRNQDDVWRAIDEFDPEMWEMLEEKDVLGVDLDEEYPSAIRVDRWSDVEDDCPEEITCTKTVAANGNGLMVSITKEARILGVDRGDVVEIVIRRKN